MNAIEIRCVVVESILVTSLILSPAIVAPLLAADAITEGYARTSSGIKIHYLQSGDATSTRALILIPGWRRPAYLWKEQLTKFAPATRVIAINPRSQGPSTTAFEGNTPESRATDLHAQDVSAYLQQFGDSSVAGIVLVDSPVSAGADELDIHKEFSKVMISTMSLYANHPAELSQGMVQSLFKKPHPDLDLAKIAKDIQRTPTDVGVAMLVADIFGADRRPAPAKFTKPALVIASAESRLLDVQQEMQKTIPNSKMVVVPDANHAVFVDAPEIFDAALKSFLDSLPAR
jgi:non-heme chloroperoxidase